MPTGEEGGRKVTPLQVVVTGLSRDRIVSLDVGEEGEVLSHGFDYFDEDEDLSEDEDDEYADSDDSGDH